MKSESGRGIGSSGPAKRSGASAATGFSPSVEGGARVATTAPASATASLEALLALQAETLTPARRSRQWRRGGRSLDLLERLEQALLSGVAPASLRTELESLRRAAEPTGEEGLDAALLEIDTRVAVELAKLEMHQQSV